jgi:phospholipase/lecithinase/hemolysin
MFGGANDFFTQFGALQAGLITSAQLQTNVLLAATQEVQQVGRLSAAGARYIMVVGGFDAAMTPSSAALDAATRGAITQLTAGYNTTLWNGLLSSGIRAIRWISSRSSTRSAPTRARTASRTSPASPAASSRCAEHPRPSSACRA